MHSDNYHECSVSNMSTFLIELEMFLNSLFSLTYPEHEEIIFATNGQIEVKYSRFKENTQMKIRAISFEKPKKFLIKNPQKIKLNMRNYQVLKRDFFDFE